MFPTLASQNEYKIRVAVLRMCVAGESYPRPNTCRRENGPRGFARSAIQGRNRRLARGHETLERGPLKPDALFRRRIRSPGAQMDPAQFHSTADDGRGPLSL